MKQLLCIVSLLFCLPLYSQNLDTFNYVPNGNLEDYTLCPDNMGQICRATFWDDAMNCHGSSEYINSCSTDYNIHLIYTNQSPRSGNGYIGILLNCGNPAYEYREFAQVALKNKLSTGKRYCAELYTNSSNHNRYVVGNISMYFSPVKDTNLWLAGIHTPQVKNHSGLLSDTVNWMKVAGTFIADGSEQYLIIGNHETNANSTVMQVNYGLLDGYYFVDDVSVCECNFQFNLGNDTTLCPGEELKLTASVSNGEFTWSDGSHGNTFTVTQPGTYWAKAYFKDYDYTSYDTIVVNYGDETFCAPPLDIPNVITPNNDGANDRLVITNSNYWVISLIIYNRWGNLIYQNANYQNDFDCNDCGESVYFYVLQATAKRSGRKIERTGTITVLR
jgi:gliding motility-associated-like protein